MFLKFIFQSKWHSLQLLKRSILSVIQGFLSFFFPLAERHKDRRQFFIHWFIAQVFTAVGLPRWSQEPRSQIWSWDGRDPGVWPTTCCLQGCAVEEAQVVCRGFNRRCGCSKQYLNCWAKFLPQILEDFFLTGLWTLVTEFSMWYLLTFVDCLHGTWFYILPACS